MGYSYRCSHLNLTIHIAKSKFHFTYSVSPRLIRTLDIPLVYSSSCEPQNHLTLIPLYPTFVVYLTTIGGRCTLCRTNLLCVNVFNNNWNVVHFTGVFFTISLLSHNYYISQRTFSIWVTEYLSSPVGLKSIIQIYETFFTYPSLFSKTF